MTEETTEALALTSTQLAAVWSWMVHGHVSRKPDGSWSRGNAARRMIDRLIQAGAWGEYDRYDKSKPKIFWDGPLIPALRVFLTDPRAVSLFSHPKAEGLREKIEARIAALTTAHAEWAVQLEAEQEAARARNATARANKIGRLREAINGLGERHGVARLIDFAANADSDAIEDFATVIMGAEHGA